MTLHEILNKYKKKSWLRLCTLHNIDKWDLVSALGEHVFPSANLINKAPPIQTKNCFQCGAKFGLGISGGTFIAVKECKCGADGTHLMSVNKLMSFYDEETCRIIISTVTQAKKKGLANTVDYWLYKGYSNEQAISQVAAVQKARSQKSPSAAPGAKGYTNRSINFWIKKGFSIKDAKLKLKESQTTNGLKYYIKKFGREIGTEKFNARIQRWLSAPNMVKMSAGRSRRSLELFEKLKVGYYGVNEKTVRGSTRVHRVDFIFEDKIIEFFGDYWHGNPKKYSAGTYIRKKKIEDVWQHDESKISDLRKNGYKVLVIWEDDYCKDPAGVLTLCEKFIYEN